MSSAKHPAGVMLQAYHDGELSAPLRDSVAAHCEQCEECQTNLADLEHLEALLAGAPTPEWSRTVWHRVRADRVPSTTPRPILAIAATAAGIVMGVVLGPVRLNGEEAGADLA